MKPSDVASAPLFEALDASGFKYDVRASARGTLYAGFRWSPGPGRTPAAYTALLEANALRLTVSDPLGPGKTLGTSDCLLKQAPLPAARLYSGDAPGQQLELTLALPMEGAVLGEGNLLALLSHLAACAEDVQGRPTGNSRQAPVLPGAPDGVSLDPALAALGLPARHGAFDMPLPGLGVVGHFHVYHLGIGWLRVAAHLQGDPRLFRARLPAGFIDRLQRWAPVGRFVPADVPGDAQLGCEVAIPFLGRKTAEAAAQALRAAVQLLGTAYQQLS